MIRDTLSFVAGFLAGALVYKVYSDQEFEGQALRLAKQRKREQQLAQQAALKQQKAAAGRAFEGSWETGITYRPGAIDSGAVSRAEAIRQAAGVLGLNPII